jgi:hypothetical protein
MRSSRTIAILIAFSMVGCTAADPTTAGSIREAISACYDHDPDGAEPCLDDLEGDSHDATSVFDVCYGEHFECSEEHGSIVCYPVLDDCFDVYDDEAPEPDVFAICYEEAAACAEDPMRLEDCGELLAICLGSFDDPAPREELPDVAEACFARHVECLEWAMDPSECDAALEICLGYTCIDDGPVHPGDECLLALEECYEYATTPEEIERCRWLVEGCYVPTPPDPCEEEIGRCFEEAAAAGLDPTVACEMILLACTDPEPTPCEEEIGACYERAADPRECDDLVASCLPPAPCDEEIRLCIERAIDAGLDPMAECEMLILACTDPTPDPCADEVRRCLEEGRPPEECEALAASCTPTDPCEDEIRACFETSPDPMVECEMLIIACTPTDPCEEEIRLCYERASDPAECDPIVAMCAPPDPCGEEIARCLEHAADPAECEMLIASCTPPTDPCEEEIRRCFETSPDPMVECAWLIDSCVPPEEPPPTDPCLDAALECFRVASTEEDLHRCEEFLAGCSGMYDPGAPMRP